jgi:hypothetical protein
MHSCLLPTAALTLPSTYTHNNLLHKKLEKTPIPSPFQDPAAPHSDDVAARGDGAADDARWPAAAADQKALETSTSTVSSSEGSNSICICAVEAPANNALLLPPARAARRLTFYD